MRHDEFIGEVQHRAKLPSRGDAERVTRITLEALSERLPKPEALGGQLPREIARHLEQGADTFERLSLDDFLVRVREKAGSDEPETIFHARAVVDVVRDAVGDDVIQKLLDQMSADFRPLFESGSEGQLGDVSRPLGSVSRNDWGASPEREREDSGSRS